MKSLNFLTTILFFILSDAASFQEIPLFAADFVSVISPAGTSKLKNQIVDVSGSLKVLNDAELCETTGTIKLKGTVEIGEVVIYEVVIDGEMQTVNDFAAQAEKEIVLTIETSNDQQNPPTEYIGNFVDIGISPPAFGWHDVGHVLIVQGKNTDDDNVPKGNFVVVAPPNGGGGGGDGEIIIVIPWPF